MIIDHPTLRFDGHYGTEPFKAVQCDYCGALATPARNIELAVDKARSAGFITRPGIEPPISPRKWCCPACNLRSQKANGISRASESV